MVRKKIVKKVEKKIIVEVPKSKGAKAEVDGKALRYNEKKKEWKEDIATKAKRLHKEGLNSKEVGEILGIDKYTASKLIKE